MKESLKRKLVAGVSSLAILSAAPAAAQDDANTEVSALHYSRFINEAYAALSRHILREASSAVDWSPADIPPAATGWRDRWTDYGLRARYCDDTLLVYAGVPEIKGVGGDQQIIQVIENEEIHTGDGARAQRLDYIEDAGTIRTGENGQRSIPACLKDDYDETLPTGRVAKFGPVIDPASRQSQQIEWARRTSACPEGQHGTGITESRKTTKIVDGHENMVSKTEGNWQETGNFCRDDYSYFTHLTQKCTFMAGPPFNREMEGLTSYRILATVTANGVKYGEPEFVSSTCFDDENGKPPKLPEPTRTTSSETQAETRTVACGSGYSGSRSQKRTRTILTSTVVKPWDQDNPIVGKNYGAWSGWSETGNSCHQVDSGGGSGGEGQYADTDGDGFGDTEVQGPCGNCSKGYGGAVVGGGSDEGGGGSSGRVICTELYYQALMTRKDWVMDCQHAARYLSPHTVNGYQWWAKWAVLKHMRNEWGMPRTDMAGRALTRFWRFLAQHRANEIRHVLKAKNPRKYAWIEGGDRPDWIGRAVRITLEPICWSIGVFAGKQDVSHVHSDPLRTVDAGRNDVTVYATFGYGFQ